MVKIDMDHIYKRYEHNENYSVKDFQERGRFLIGELTY